jgi:1-aminocyclopropane-1-carboxylate deaminase/D-cysteine desulfhydrase-like pyridoxal-dependent ACC family enzyme
MIPLFEHYPELGETLPHVSLGNFPTPVRELESLGVSIGVDALYVKRDDLSGQVYGGNKVRKLEFLLGEALRDERRAVLTFGGAGSNHALATAVHARQVGLECISMLTPQPSARYVRCNLLMGFSQGAKLHYYRDKRTLAIGTFCQRLWHTLKSGHPPQIIPIGGSSPLGATGFVNAALELKAQIAAGELPEPDKIYLPMGSTGTAVGLTLGLAVADLKSKVIPVTVSKKRESPVKRFADLFEATNDLLRAHDPSFPKVRLAERDVQIRQEFIGPGYAIFTPEAVDAIARMRQEAGIELDGTYSGKALAALLHDMGHREENEVILFWDTYNSKDISSIIAEVDYHALPKSFHGYFEEEVQPLDRAS